jgi:hypothetical protein
MQTEKDLQSIVEWSLSMKGMKIGGVMMIRRMWPSKKSELQRAISTILTIYSRAGCEKADEPSLRPYQTPDHQAILVSSDLNSRDKNTAIRIFWMARCTAMMQMIPRTACEASQSSRNH